MNILILGGTMFLGRTLAEAALARGHNVTLFNRGQRNPELFPIAEKLRGDRDGDLSALQGRQWDVVIDTCGYVPRVVRASAELLAEQVERYIFISTISVYEHFRELGLDETAPVGTLADETVEEVTGETYGPLKALCEQAVERALPGRSLIIRPGLIVGPHDPTDRFTYWPWRISRGGEVLAPGNPGMHIQVIDVRDLSEWTLDMAEGRQTGVYNATGPAEPIPMGTFLETCSSVSGADTQLTWVDEAFLLEQGVQQWSELPLWLAMQREPDMIGFGDVSIARAAAAGLTFRSLEATIRDTLNWAATRPSDHPWRAGLSAEREAEVLKAWHEHTKSNDE